ncbi:MAG: aquaporin family protein [Mycoplasma sp.]|nr:aquaporin family protein [Mycoplasma sp.]
MELGKLFSGEFVGTMVLIIIGNGIVANFSYKKGAANKDSFLTILLSWAAAVMVGVTISWAMHGKGMINPAGAIMNWVAGNLNVGEFFIAVLAQFMGAIVGQVILDVLLWNHIKDRDNIDKVLGAHATGATFPNGWASNMMSEFLGTVILLVGASSLAIYNPLNGATNTILVGIIVLAIGAATGSVTGFAINPARDLGPRLVYQLLPIPQKPSANWEYAIVPFIMPILAGVMVGGLHWFGGVFKVFDFSEQNSSIEQIKKIVTN